VITLNANIAKRYYLFVNDLIFNIKIIKITLILTNNPIKILLYKRHLNQEHIENLLFFTNSQSVVQSSKPAFFIY